jgi:ABC-type antimicrobial peptide transport system permease subunit
MQDPQQFHEIKERIEKDPRLKVQILRESEFYAKQSRAVTMVLNFLGYFVSSIMAIGAVFGAINTMDAAIASRHREIAVLLSLGFRPKSILSSFLFECILICLLGGVLGCLLALPLNFVSASTTNWQSFTELAFNFQMTPKIMVRGLLFALMMGIIGGFFPSWRASRQPIAQVLHQE